MKIDNTDIITSYISDVSVMSRNIALNVIIVTSIWGILNMPELNSWNILQNNKICSYITYAKLCVGVGSTFYILNKTKKLYI